MISGQYWIEHLNANNGEKLKYDGGRKCWILSQCVMEEKDREMIPN
ncbi:MAG: hypothetical protein ACD_15C00037G0027 [uncultured bacterium]|nr:MAG: hypothetical protein ACD_15C00037G0027 [uncultured bacterium]